MSESETTPGWAARAFPTVVRYTGLLIAIYETLWEQVDRPVLLGLSGSMMLGSLAMDAYRDRGEQ